ncbi:hypothetical protein ACEK07_46690 [Alcanivoracaceae bacterium MT1]
MDELIKRSDIKFSRWHSVRYKDIRMSTEELEVLQAIFPMYQLWLISGNIAPEVGQTSPEYDAANATLKQHGEGLS